MNRVPISKEGDVISFTELSMTKIYSIFGVTNETLKKERDEIWDMALSLIKSNHSYTDRIEKLSATDALAQVMTKAKLEVACGIFSNPTSLIPDKYLVIKADDYTFTLTLLNKDLLLPPGHEKEWVRFKEILPNIVFNREEYPHYVMGHNF